MFSLPEFLADKMEDAVISRHTEAAHIRWRTPMPNFDSRSILKKYRKDAHNMYDQQVCSVPWAALTGYYKAVANNRLPINKQLESDLHHAFESCLMSTPDSFA